MLRWTFAGARPTEDLRGPLPHLQAPERGDRGSGGWPPTQQPARAAPAPTPPATARPARPRHRGPGPAGAVPPGGPARAGCLCREPPARLGAALLWHSSSTRSPSSAPSCCAWDGVGCEAAGRVSALRLPYHGLAGALQSPPLAALPFLWDLDLSRNAVTGVVAAVLAALPGTLRAANLSSNLLHGAFPGGRLPAHLEPFDASNNSNSGVLVPGLCASAPKLRMLDLSANRLTGALPSSSPQPLPCASTLRKIFFWMP